MSKTIAAILLAVTLTGAMASSVSAQPYGYYHHHHHWGHWRHWRHHRHWR